MICVYFLKAELQKKLVEEIVPTFWNIFQDTLNSNSSGYMVGDRVCFLNHVSYSFNTSLKASNVIINVHVIASQNTLLPGYSAHCVLHIKYIYDCAFNQQIILMNNSSNIIAMTPPKK